MASKKLWIMRLALVKNSRWLIVIFGVATVGLLDAGYLTYEHYSGNKVMCTLIHGCDQVLNSQYATVFGVPIALFGVVFYLTILGFCFHYMQRKLSQRASLSLLLFSGLGFVISLVLSGLQAFAIHAWCQFCLLSALSSTLLFGLSIMLYLSTRPKVEKNDATS